MKLTIGTKEINITAKRIVLFLSPLIYMWNVWQHEILMKTTLNYIKYPILSPQQTFLDWVWGQDFAFFTGIHLQWGTGYDFTLLGQAIAYLMLFGMVILLMYEGRKNKGIVIKEIKDQQ